MAAHADYPNVRGFEIERLLGRGGMAEVFLARQTALNRPVALKVLRQNSEAQAAALVRFEQEARLIAQLSHPNIVGIYDIGRTDAGELFYAMPYLPEGDLKRQTRPLAAEWVRDILSCVLSALEHAHSHGVIHRDIKPENILFDGAGRPLLADFGVAFSAAGRERVTTAGFTVGSAGYMSPEQARGMRVDGRSDLYSVGVLAFEMLTGELPFDGPDNVAIAIAQVEQPIPRLPAKFAAWQPFLDRALAAPPEQRFDTAGQMREALPSGKAAAAQPKSARLLWPWVAALLLVAVGVVAAWSLRAPAPSLADIEALLARGELHPPARPNALDELKSKWAQDPSAAPIKLRLLDALVARAEVAARARDWVALSDALAPVADAAAAFGLTAAPRALALNSELDALIQADLKQALGQFDRAHAESALALAAMLPTLTPATAGLRTQVQALPGSSGEMSDLSGLTLRLIERPRLGRAGWAITPLPLTPLEVGQLVAIKPGPDCVSDPAAQTCLSLSQVKELAQALSSQSGERYRLPTIAEWKIVQRAVLPKSRPLLVFTDTCRLETVVVDTPNALERGAGKIRSLFGGSEARSKTKQRCSGYWATGFSSERSRVLGSSERSKDVAVVLVREIAALKR